MFYKLEDVPNAKHLLSLGHQRADQLKAGKHPWTKETGLVVRGYKSTLDDSVIPYGLDIPSELSHHIHKKASRYLVAWSEQYVKRNSLPHRTTSEDEPIPPTEYNRTSSLWALL